MKFSALLLAFLLASGVALAADKINWGSLNLTQQQQQNINQLEDQWSQTCASTMPQIEADKAELMKHLNSPNGDQAKVLMLQNRISANKAKLQSASLQVFLKKKQQLNPDQRSQLQQLMGE